MWWFRIVCVLFSLAPDARSASFDCDKAVTLVEKAICSERQLSVLDDLLMRAYKQALVSSPDPKALRANQRKWLTGVRGKCQDVACLKQAYDQRLIMLQRISSTGEKLCDGFSGTYESKNGELDIRQLFCGQIRFSIVVMGSYVADKPFSPNVAEIDGEALLKGNTASYNDDECTLVFKFLRNSVDVSQSGWCPMMGNGVSATGIFQLKSSGAAGVDYFQ